MLRVERSTHLPSDQFCDVANFVTRIQPDPKETYQQALEKAGTPTETLVSGDPLNKTSMITDDDYISNYNALTIFEDMEAAHEKFG
jgi:hypothetical protein